MINIKGLNKKFGDHNQVLQNISIRIPSGCSFALLGPNGSGKSTFLKCLLGVVTPDSGKLKGIDPQTMVGYMPQNPAFPKNLRVIDLIRFFESLTRDIPKYKDQLIHDMRINTFSNKKIAHLSHGMKQKINILQCFMFNPSIIILDEPTAGLDPSISYYLKEFINFRKKEEKTILFTSHIMSEVEEMADEMAVLIEGEIVLHSKPSLVTKKANAKNLEEAVRIYWTKQNK